jgi:hypothetical protein
MAAKVKDPVSGTYQHYKGAFYEVLGIADEAVTGNKFVVYQAIGITENLLDDEGEAGPVLGHRVVRNGAKGALAVATVARFTELVDGAEYWGGKRVPRFTLVSAAP